MGDFLILAVALVLVIGGIGYWFLYPYIGIARFKPYDENSEDHILKASSKDAKRENQADSKANRPQENNF
jgi:hypothetical protein